MNRFILIVLSACMLVLFNACNKKRKGKPIVLVFNKTQTFYHESIPAGTEAIIKLGLEYGFDVDTTSSSHYFCQDSLQKYAAVIFLSTTGNLLDHEQEVSFERYMQAGGGYVGIHAASDAEYDWKWYGRLVGAYFKNHPRPQLATLHVHDHQHPSTKGLPNNFEFTDEWYNFKELSPNINLLISLDESTYEGGENGNVHPIAWYQEYDGGRSFFTGLGHSIASFSDSIHLAHILGGIQYAIGDNLELNYKKATSQYAPKEERFKKVQLIEGGLFEPTEMAILPNLDILIAQRRGELLLYDTKKDTLIEVGFLDVYHQTSVEGVNAEEGFMGLALDPNYVENNYIFAFYSPSDTSVNRLSRYVFKDDSLHMDSEKIILEFHSERQICCHTGGSIAFDKKGLLYLSTGDNSTPFDQKESSYVNNGFAPLDTRPGFEQYDAQRTSGNSADLRGKILRIRVLSDGSYESPDGNLFTDDVSRPEIYIMGNRNPYRISIDPKNSYLYWGEVGPDAGNDSLQTRGPRGYDEINQARKAGFFGWPYFVGDNYPYLSFDYSTGEYGDVFTAEGALNNSINNTGLKVLPPAAPAFIWYPYAESPDFPQLGSGGRNAMAGPVYYSDLFPKETRYPSYYDGKLFIYDWMRGWVKVVSMQENGDYDKMEPFLESEKFASPIDMEVGPDGRIYVLEYGSGWFSKNTNSGLARIDYYAGNLPPIIAEITVEEESGYTPFVVRVRANVKDPENDDLRYTWIIDGKEIKTEIPELEYKISEVGDYTLELEVEDVKNNTVKSMPLNLYAGNSIPKITIDIGGYSPEKIYKHSDQVNYEVFVSNINGEVNPENLYISIEYLETVDRAVSTQGHQKVSRFIVGNSIMKASNCESCHKIDGKSVGPSFVEIAKKYGKKSDAKEYLSKKILEGGSGVWGDIAMAANPSLKPSELNSIIDWIFSLDQTKNSKLKSLPLKGKFNIQNSDNKYKVMRLSAHYTNQPTTGLRPISQETYVDFMLEE